MVDELTEQKPASGQADSAANAADAEVPQKKWYIVHAQSGREGLVMQAIKDHARFANMEDKIGEIVVPTEEVLEMRGGKKRKSNRKIFPGYVLVQMIMDNHTWHLISHLNGVIGFVGGTNEKPAPISDKTVDDILQRVQEGAEKPKPKVLFAPGEVVRVVDGPFADFDGVVEDVNYDKSRLRVSVLIFGRSTPVELEFSQVQKA